MKDYLFGRTTSSLQVGTFLYVSGLLYLSRNLFYELKDELAEEKRFFGIVLTYNRTLQSAYTTLFDEVTDEEEDVYQRIIYLYKQIIVKEHKKLTRRGLSRADAIIVLINKILDIIGEVPSLQEYPNKKEYIKIKKVIDKLYDNIRNRSKKSKLYTLTNWIKKLMDMELVGKHPLPMFSIREEEKKKEKLPLSDSGIRIDDEPTKVTELEW